MTPTVRQRSTLVASWALAAVAVGVLLAVAEAADGPLDDPDPARQRPGLLDAFGPPTPAPPVDDQLPAREELTVVFFERPGRGGALCDALESSDLATEAALVLVVQGTGREPRCAGATVVDDPNGDLAVRYGLRRPAAGAPRSATSLSTAVGAGPLPDARSRRRQRARRGSNNGRGRPMNALTLPRHLGAELRVCLWCIAAVLIEVALYLSYRGHDARFHWFTHFFVGAATALAIMTVVAWRRRRPVRYPLVWPLLGHLFAMTPDLVFTAGTAHERWMDVFLGHISTHLVWGRNLTWYAVFLTALAAYLMAVDRAARTGGS